MKNIIDALLLTDGELLIKSVVVVGAIGLGWYLRKKARGF